MSYPNTPPHENNPYPPPSAPPRSPLTPLLLLGGAFVLALGVGLGAGRILQPQSAGPASQTQPVSAPASAPASNNSMLSQSSGAAVEVPEVLGLREAEARDLIKARALRADVTTGASLSVPAGRVMGQYPAAGQGVPGGGDMRIRISLGPPAGAKSAAAPASVAAPAPSTREIVIVKSRDDEAPRAEAPRPDPRPDPPTPRYSSSAPSYDYALSPSDLADKSNWELDVMRNTIYAKYGRIFRRSDLQSYFDRQSWYRRNSGFRESWLSSTEKRNAALIASYQKGG